MTDAKPARPRQVTLLGWSIVAGSVLVVLFSFQQMASLGSIEAQEAAEDLIAEPPGSGLGLTADGVQSLMRVLCVVAGGAAVAAAILGWQVLQRSRSARIGLSVLAPVILVAGLVPASFLSMLVAGATVLLWTQPARDWFAGREPAQHPALAGGRPPASVAPPPAGAPGAGPNRLPDYAPPPGTAAPPGQQAVVAWPAAEPPAAAGRRPQALVTACVVTIVTSVLTALTMVVALLVVLADRASFEAEVAREMAGNQAYDGVDVDLVLGVLVGLLVVFVLWALLAVVLAALALRGSNAARITLVVSSFGAAGASLLGILVVVPLLVGATAIGAAVLLLRREVGAWYAAKRHP